MEKKSDQIIRMISENSQNAPGDDSNAIIFFEKIIRQKNVTKN